MKHHGKRFLTVKQFIRHASALKVRFLNNKELEFYEQHCLLLPVARTHMPPPLAIALAEELNRLPITNPDVLKEPDDEWQRLHMLSEDGVHPFDRERERGNRFLEIPNCATFCPWDRDKVSVDLPGGDFISRNTVERYYAYWQVHVVELLRQPLYRYYERAPFLRELPESHDFQKWYGLPDDTERFRTLNGMAVGYNMLTLYEVAKQAAYREAFLGIPRGQTLSESASNELQELLTQRAKRALRTSSVDETSFFNFVYELTQLIEEYRRRERIALAEDAEQDLREMTHLAYRLFGHDWDGILSAAERHVGENLANTLRWFDPIETTVREARHNLESILQGGIGARVSSNDDDLSDTPQEIIEFCLENDLYGVLTGLENYSYDYTEKRRDGYPGFFHRRLLHLALAVEQFARGILDVSQATHQGKSLKDLIGVFGKESCWLTQFRSLVSEGETSDKEKDKPLDQKVLILARSIQASDCEDDEVIAKTFVIAVAARNLVTHRHEFLLYDVVVALAESCTNSIVLIWLLAKKKGLV